RSLRSRCDSLAPARRARGNFVRGGQEMTLPVFQFWDRLGESVNISTLDDRDRISKAELYYVMDVGNGVWCRQKPKASGC
ncbi:hypothetical protein, partial [Halocatena pleomorpha]|uniref:hypothetical protein n=1 Tax=Halocatena pleomorpha TaxID=1785090 RepID=UPI00163A1099